jgi:EAL domain-containing protein (putative c-di-GMP-specific phosphodiesterase class I)
MSQASDWLAPGRLGVVFQPIVRLSTGDVYGYEVLGRAVGDDPPGPSTLVARTPRAGSTSSTRRGESSRSRTSPSAT